MNKINTEEFIRRSVCKYGDRLDYSETIFSKMISTTNLICKDHGRFTVIARNHLERNLSGCPVCRKNSFQSKMLWTTEKFIAKSKSIHGDKYDYSKVVYTGSFNYVEIICPIHGSFYQTPSNHTHVLGYGCKGCSHLESDEENEVSGFIKPYPIMSLPTIEQS